MLIRNPDPKGRPQDTDDADETMLCQALAEHNADACMRLLGRWKGIPDSARGAALERLATEQDARLQQIILNHLIPDLRPEEVEPLYDLLGSDSAGLRNQVIDALGQLRSGATAETLEGAIRSRLHSPDPDLRILTLNLIAALELPGLASDVEVILYEDDVLNVCMTALDTVLMLGNEECWPAIENLLVRFPDEPFVEFSVRRARHQLLGTD
ncbi:MAG: hypothetical protein LAT62_00560 [Natronospirillum sp.]|uniref:hypothetical protein n=1 Tax=Natronospirillum sp. TaxID=2812955 RepID=UPI0025E54BA3|nr:hypothetical protein [Natronospirillum sp.]MCH8550393.1 hypothetical protein [Natronospirillum sp.]